MTHPQKQKTRAQLSDVINILHAEIADLRDTHERTRMNLQAAEQGGVDLRKKLDEVKERLHAAETENNRLRGYLDRVMEDDHAREELVTIGEPGGEQQLVPKRKHREPPRVVGPIMNGAADAAVVNGFRNGFMGMSDEPKRRRHWVSY